MAHEVSASNESKFQEEGVYPIQEPTTEAPKPSLAEKSVDTHTSPDETAAGVPHSEALEREAGVQDQSVDPQTLPDTIATAGVRGPEMLDREADVQDQNPGLTEKSANTPAPDGRADGPLHHKSGMAEKLKVTFAGVKERVAGHGSNSPTGASGLQQSPGAQVTSPSSSARKPYKDLAEKIIDKLPGSHSNPYSTGHYVPPPTPSEELYEDEPPEKGPGLVDKLRTLVHKPGRRTATVNANTSTAGSPRKDTYTQSPTPSKDGDKTTGHTGHMSDETWPTPEKPGYHSMPGATYKNEEGYSIEGPTRPREEDIKPDDLVTKLLDKFHLSPKAGTKTSAQSPK